jgi:predicted DNA-binding transcriptional regulator AlpA
VQARVVKTAPGLNEVITQDKVNPDALLFENRIVFLSVRDVARWLGYSVGTLYNLTSTNKIPHRKKRGKLYFDPGEIQN